MSGIGELIKKIMNKITLTITTCKRLELFKQTIKSFFSNCLDTDLIQEIIIIDDSSSINDIKDMQYFLKDYKYKITIISGNQKNHALSLNVLFSKVKTDYIFHLEDDWEFKKGDLIRQAFQIIDDNKNIKSVIMRNWIEQGAKNQIKKMTKAGIKYYIHNYNGLRFVKGNINTYPGYSLNPSLQNIKEIRDIGEFENKELFELRFAYNYYSNGFLIGMTSQDYCKHIGGALSAYKLNNTKE